MPVYNGGDDVAENVEVIRRAIAGGLPEEDIELVVVSDGSLDGTSERLLTTQFEEGIRVIHYDRNLGKGYAVKAGALAAEGDWVGIVDGDLDLDPAAIPDYVEVARREGLDFAIGSKRHPESIVHYPFSRRLASRCYQQLNRLLFRLDVRDTQVGLKVFSRDVADHVVPLLLVKQFAFDLELLAVARAVGYGRVRELPIRLDYRFTGSQVRSRAVARALLDTAAIFYRLRVLKTYQRRRAFFRNAERHPAAPPLVTVIATGRGADSLDDPRLELVSGDDPVAAARRAHGELVAVLARDARPAGNWVSAAVPYFADPRVAAVVAPTIAPFVLPLHERTAAAVLESRLGGGSRRSRYLPGNVRMVADHPAESVVVRRDEYLVAAERSVGGERLVAWLVGHGREVVYTPDTSVSAAPPPVFAPHLRGTVRHASARGSAARSTRGGSMSSATALSLLPAACAVAGVALLPASGVAQRVGVGLVAAYAAVVVGASALGGTRFHSAPVGILMIPALAATHAAYAGGFLSGLVRGR